MYLHVHFAASAAWLLLAIGGLVRVMACAVGPTNLEKEGIAFWKGLLVSLLLIARILRPGRPLAHTISRS
jgi:hypothetical protein